MVVAGAFLYTDRYGSFAIPVKMVFVNDNDNRCISGVFGWDFGLVLSNVFVFYFYLFFFLSNFDQGEVVFSVVPGKNVKLCPR